MNADHAASHVGKAEGVVTLLRASSYYRAKRHTPIPVDILIRVSVPIYSSIFTTYLKGSYACRLCVFTL